MGLRVVTHNCHPVVSNHPVAGYRHVLLPLKNNGTRRCHSILSVSLYTVCNPFLPIETVTVYCHFTRMGCRSCCALAHTTVASPHAKLQHNRLFKPLPSFGSASLSAYQSTTKALREGLDRSNDHYQGTACRPRGAGAGAGAKWVVPACADPPMHRTSGNDSHGKMNNGKMARPCVHQTCRTAGFFSTCV